MRNSQLLNDIKKQKLLGVSPKTLETYGAVSEQTAREMALGAKHVSGADIAISTTGLGDTGRRRYSARSD